MALSSFLYHNSVGDVVMVISQLLMTTKHDQIRKHSIFCLHSLAKTLPDWSLHCPAGLKETIEEYVLLLNDLEYEVGAEIKLLHYPLNIL